MEIFFITNNKDPPDPPGPSSRGLREDRAGDAPTDRPSQSTVRKDVNGVVRTDER